MTIYVLILQSLPVVVVGPPEGADPSSPRQVAAAVASSAPVVVGASGGRPLHEWAGLVRLHPSGREFAVGLAGERKQQKSNVCTCGQLSIWSLNTLVYD